MSKELPNYEIIEKSLKKLELQHEMDTIELEIAHKKLKALEIIKEKRVDVGLLVSCDNVEEYNYRVDEKWKTFSRRLTQEEYDLLKEIL